MHTILTGHVLDRLREIPDASVDCIVTSPPYWQLRDYGVDGQIGLEPSFAEFLENLSVVFEECKRVLKRTGTMWVNMGDAYSASGAVGSQTGKQATNRGSHYKPGRRAGEGSNLKPKNLIGQPWRLAFALQDAGWILRSDIIWAKPNGMPGSQEDRCTSSKEYIFLFSKAATYWSDFDAIKTPPRESSLIRTTQDLQAQAGSHRRHAGFNDRWDAMEREEQQAKPAMMRDVWFVAPAQTKGGHYAVMPDEIARRCILAGCPEGGTVLDPFAGSGTTLAVAVALGRKAIGIELNPEYVALIEKRMAIVTPSLFMEAAS